MKKIVLLLAMGLLLFSCGPQENPDPDTVIISENAKVIDDQTWETNMLSIDTTDYTITFREDITTAQELNPGDILVSASGNGLLRKIKNITKTKAGSEIVVETEFASLTDLIEEGAIKAEIPLTTDMIESVVFYNATDEVESTQVKGTTSILIDETFKVRFYDHDGDLSTTSDQVNGLAKLLCNMIFIFDVDIEGATLKTVDCGLKTEERFYLELVAGLKRTLKDEARVYTIFFYPISIPVTVTPPIVIVITPKVEFFMGIEGYINASVSWDLTQSFTVDAGMKYRKNSGWSSYNNQEFKFVFNEPHINANAGVAAYVKAVLSTKLYNVAGPYLSGKAYGRFDADLLETPWWTLHAGYNIYGGINVKILDLFTLDYKAELLNYEKLITHAPIKPSVSTGSVTNITITTATCSGNVTSDGKATVTARGVCWSTSENPTVANSKTTNGTGMGTYTSNITGLSPNTTYYVRAYATNSEGTAYGEQKTFTTNAQQATPSVTSGDVTNITTTTASCSGNVTSDGGSSVTVSGVCWSTSENPTVANSKTTDGADLGPYTSHITGLSPNTTYYVRAYATNAEGTAYGEEQRTFKTLPVSDIEYGSFTDSRDGNVYKTVTIGEQVWMAENLAYLPSVVGPGTGSTSTAHYYVYGYDGTDVATAKATSNYTTYGVLYNWPAALTVCPDGWHLPSDEEWTQLEEYLIANGYNYDGTTTRDKIAISLASATGWNSSTDTGAIGNTNTAYDAYRNKSGFSALPGGYRYLNGAFNDIGIQSTWWSSTEDDTGYAWGRGLFYDYSYVRMYHSSKAYGFSVRCLRD
jgi:uncharacterized protein (TIGR02145 family)